jgi:hypothetical protein
LDGIPRVKQLQDEIEELAKRYFKEVSKGEIMGVLEAVKLNLATAEEGAEPPS